MMYRAHLLNLYLVCVVTFALAAQDIRPPQLLGKLRLVRVLEGADAQRFLNRLHQKEVTPRSSIAAEYEAKEGNATLYISTYASSRQAKTAAVNMMSLIRAGNRTFSHYSESATDGVTTGRCLGMGQVHYVFQSRLGVYWLSVDPLLETEALPSLFRNIHIPR